MNEINPFLEQYKNPSVIHLDTSIIATALKVRECKHPLDGGTLRSRSFDFDKNPSLTNEQQVVDILRQCEHEIKGIYTAQLMKVKSSDNPDIIKTMLLVRAIFNKGKKK